MGYSTANYVCYSPINADQFVFETIKKFVLIFSNPQIETHPIY